MKIFDKVIEAVAAIVLAIVLIGVNALLTGLIVKWCWNYVMPLLFNFREITWGQAWCLCALVGMFRTGATISRDSK